MFDRSFGGQYQRLTASGVVKANQGILLGFIVASGTPTVSLNDAPVAGSVAAGNLILNTMQTAVGVYYPLNVRFVKGLYATQTGAGDITFIYQ